MLKRRDTMNATYSTGVTACDIMRYIYEGGRFRSVRVKRPRQSGKPERGSQEAEGGNTRLRQTGKLLNDCTNTLPCSPKTHVDPMIIRNAAADDDDDDAPDLELTHSTHLYAGFDLGFLFFEGGIFIYIPSSPATPPL